MGANEKVLLKKIKRYVDEDGIAYGPVVGLVMSTGKGQVGYSIANVNKGDVFDRALAETICRERMSVETPGIFFSKYYSYFSDSLRCMSVRVYEEMDRMRDRSERYFK